MKRERHWAKVWGQGGGLTKLEMFTDWLEVGFDWRWVRRLLELAMAKALRSLDVTRTQSCPCCYCHPHHLYPGRWPQRQHRTLSMARLFILFGGKMELERNAKNQLCLKVLDRVYISGITYSFEARILEFS